MTSNPDISAAARQILVGNDKGGYTVPNGRVYPFQWNWDSAFVALGFATFDRARAWEEVETLFNAQWDDGFVPHIIFWKDDEGYFPGPSVWATGTDPKTSGITQPPVAASVVRWLWESAESEEEQARAEALFPKILAWHRWFHRFRDPIGKGLVLSTHPWEGGRDNSPEWDKPSSTVDVSKVEPYVRRDTSHLDQSMRPTKLDYDRYLALVQFGRDQGWDHDVIARENPFRVYDVGLTLILLRADRDLSWLASVLGHDDIAQELEGRVKLAEEGVNWLWNDEVGAFCSRDAITGDSSSMVTSASFLAFFADVGSSEQRAALLANFDRIAGRVKFMVPSFDPDHELFDSIRYWRGPSWAVVNFMVSKGLRETGYEERAERVRQDNKTLMSETGFYEAFCPMEGRGTGGDDFSWTAAMWLHWCGK